MARAERVEIANNFLRVISRHGREFFRHNDYVSYFELDDRGRVWYVDKYRGSRIWTHRRDGQFWGHRFSEGGTLQLLCLDLQRYIMGRVEYGRVLRHLGPWPSWSSDPWAYGEDMEKVRSQCADLDKEWAEYVFFCDSEAKADAISY